MRVVAIAMAGRNTPPSWQAMIDFAEAGRSVRSFHPHSRTSVGLGVLKEVNEINVLKDSVDSSFLRNMGPNSVWNKHNIRFVNKYMGYSDSEQRWDSECPDAVFSVNLFLDICEMHGLEMLFKKVHSLR